MNWLQKIAIPVDVRNIPFQISGAISSLLGRGEWRVARKPTRNWSAGNEKQAVFESVLLGTDVPHPWIEENTFDVSIYLIYTLPFNENSQDSPTMYDSATGVEGMMIQASLRADRQKEIWSPGVNAPYKIAKWVVSVLNGESQDEGGGFEGFDTGGDPPPYVDPSPDGVGVPEYFKISQLELPSDLYNDMGLLHNERQWRRAVSTPGSLVKHKEGWSGKVIELRGDPVNGGQVLVEHEMEGVPVQRFYSALELSPVMSATMPPKSAQFLHDEVAMGGDDMSWLQKISQTTYYHCSDSVIQEFDLSKALDRNGRLGVMGSTVIEKAYGDYCTPFIVVGNVLTMDHPQRLSIITEFVLPDIVSDEDFEGNPLYGPEFDTEALIRASNSILSWENREIIDKMVRIGYDAVEGNGGTGAIHILVFNTDAIQVIDNS